jgi:hypothetical protein
VKKIELAFIKRVLPFPRGDYRGVAGCLFQVLIQRWIPPPSSPPLEKGGQPKVVVLIIDKHIFSPSGGTTVAEATGRGMSNRTETPPRLRRPLERDF